jgi:hypothetical protein
MADTQKMQVFAKMIEAASIDLNNIWIGVDTLRETILAEFDKEKLDQKSILDKLQKWHDKAKEYEEALKQNTTDLVILRRTFFGPGDRDVQGKNIVLERKAKANPEAKQLVKDFEEMNQMARFLNQYIKNFLSGLNGMAGREPLKENTANRHSLYSPYRKA